MRVNLGKFTLLVLRTSYSTVVVSIRALWNVYYTVCITTLVVLCKTIFNTPLFDLTIYLCSPAHT